MKHPHQSLTEAEVTFWITAIVLFALIVLAGYLFWGKTAVYGP
jgi:polyferredoxin